MLVLNSCSLVSRFGESLPFSRQVCLSRGPESEVNYPSLQWAAIRTDIGIQVLPMINGVVMLDHIMDTGCLCKPQWGVVENGRWVLVHDLVQ